MTSHQRSLAASSYLKNLNYRFSIARWTSIPSNFLFAKISTFCLWDNLGSSQGIPRTSLTCLIFLFYCKYYIFTSLIALFCYISDITRGATSNSYYIFYQYFFVQISDRRSQRLNFFLHLVQIHCAMNN